MRFIIKNSFLTSLILICSLISFLSLACIALAESFNDDLINNYQKVPLEVKIGQMLMLGFSGDTINLELQNYIQKYHIGSVILFNKSLAKGKESNITSPKQVKLLNAKMQKLANIKLFIAVDQEGGKVARLNSSNGFYNTKTHEELGKANNLETVYQESAKIAKTLQSVGFNMNFAPTLDVNINPDNPIIGHFGRSFSADPQKVILDAKAYIKAQQDFNIITSIKHFPGHGSSKTDSHLGMVDITNTYQAKELKPFIAIINDNYTDTIMVAHLFNKNIDAKYPASLSKKFITNLLRKQLHFNGVIISDDLKMGAIEQYYSLEDSIVSFINAGGDIIAYSNNLGQYHADVAQTIIKLIKKNIKNGNISIKRIDESYLRIMKLKKEKLY